MRSARFQPCGVLEQVPRGHDVGVHDTGVVPPPVDKHQYAEIVLLYPILEMLEEGRELIEIVRPPEFVRILLVLSFPVRIVQAALIVEFDEKQLVPGRLAGRGLEGRFAALFLVYGHLRSFLEVEFSLVFEWITGNCLLRHAGAYHGVGHAP